MAFFEEGEIHTAKKLVCASYVCSLGALTLYAVTFFVVIIVLAICIHLY